MTKCKCGCGLDAITSEIPYEYKRPEVGTLKEIGAKVGDVVEFDWGDGHKVIELATDEMISEWLTDTWRIISRAQTGPVRTVTTTRREIVPGKYGNVTVWGDGWPSVKGISNIDELTDAIATLTTIRDAMQVDNTD